MKLFFSIFLPSLPPFSAFPGQGGPLSFHLFCALLFLFGIIPVFGHVQKSPLNVLLKYSSSEAYVSYCWNPPASHLFVEQMSILVWDSVVASHNHLSHPNTLPLSSREEGREGDLHLQTACHLSGTMPVNPISTSWGRHCHTHFIDEIC